MYGKTPISVNELARGARRGVPGVEGLLIGGDVVAGETTRLRKAPASGQRLGQMHVASRAQVEAAVAAARAAQPGWQAMGPRGRGPILRHIKEKLAEDVDFLVEHVVAETGKPTLEALYEVMSVLELFDHVLGRAPALLADQRLRLPQVHLWPKRSFLAHEPWGVCGLIMPWNFPLVIPAGEILQAIAVGNTVVLKPSELAPFTATCFAGLLGECGLPPGVVNVVTGEGEVGAALVEAEVDKVSFVGSVATGRQVEAAARARGRAVSLELGGKDAALVLRDASVREAAQGVVWGAMMNAGQGCSSVERALVHADVHDAFVAAAKQAAERIVVGDGADEASWMGPVISRSQLKTIREHVDDAREQGATVVTGGEVLKDLGPLFYAPTILADVTPEMRVMREETFGPVLAVRRVGDVDQAVAEANSLPYALGASVWSRDVGRAEAVARRLRVGSVWINDLLFSHASPQAPWGGPGDSGGSWTHGDHGMLGYLRPKFVSVDGRAEAIKDAWYPYGPDRLAFTRAGLDLLHRPGVGRKVKAVPEVLRGLKR